MVKVLVTGGSGYIGSTLVPLLLARGHHVTVLDDFRYSETSLLGCAQHEKFRVVRGDVRHEATLLPLLREADIIVPLAAIVGRPACERSPFEAVSVNHEAIVLLNRLRSRRQRVIFATTNSGYGHTEASEPIDERQPLDPISLYGRTKVNAEASLLESENAVSFRLATVFGISPRLRLDLLVNHFTYLAWRDRTLTLYEGEYVRNYVAVQDVARLFGWAIEQDGKLADGPYNFGLSNANLNKWQLCEIIGEQVHDFEWTESLTGSDPDQRNYLVSNQKIEDAGFKAEIPVRDGVRQLLRAFPMLETEKYGNA